MQYFPLKVSVGWRYESRVSPLLNLFIYALDPTSADKWTYPRGGFVWKVDRGIFQYHPESVDELNRFLVLCSISLNPRHMSYLFSVEDDSCQNIAQNDAVD